MPALRAILYLCLFINATIFAIDPNIFNGALFAFVAFMSLLVTISR